MPRLSTPSPATGRRQAFLSYTRRDDEYFGGQITALRQLLELGYQVVTGDTEFTIFQDVDAIELGQKWQERIDEAIDESTLLIPVITPLFFRSEPCRDELSHFIAHEKSLGRDDLILPIYFFTAAVLEKEELRRAEPLAAEIASRQLYDWRAQVELAPDDPQRHRSVTDLARSVAAAMQRATGRPDAGDRLARGDEGAAQQLTDLAAKVVQSALPSADRQHVLWVDDHPENTAIERNAMAVYNFDFTLARSTGEALARLRERCFDAVVSDMGRGSDQRAGYTLLEALRDSGDHTPYFICSSSSDPAHVREALQLGAQGATNRGDELLQSMLQILGR